jgi:hypothetical protein
VLQNLPAETEELTPQSNIPATEPTPTPTYKDLCETTAKAALHLLSISQNFSATLPPAVSRFLPGARTAIPPEQIWAPVLAWITLHSLPRHDDQAALFDKLQLRSALAETFTAIGMEGENTWRAAARVRILLSHPETSPSATKTEKFWSDPDVRWLTGVNESSGNTYFNKEGFEEMLGWLENTVLELCKSAEKAGFNLNLYLNPKPLELALEKVDSDPKPTPTSAPEAKPAPKQQKKPTPTTR